MQVPIKKGLLWILFSILLVSGSAGLGLVYFRFVKHLYAQDNTYRIVAIVQSTHEKEALKTVYFAELLNLSVDRPTNLYAFSINDAKRKLLASPLIKEATIKKIRPGTIYIDYTLRKPVAFLGGYSNIVLDAEGFLFPFKPFFTPKNLPEIIVDLEEKKEVARPLQWGDKLKGRQIELAIAILGYSTSYYCDETAHLQRIDVSQAFASSCGQRQIVIAFEDTVEKEVNGRAILFICPRILRLNPDEYKQGLANYAVLRKQLIAQLTPLEGTITVERRPPTIIDLRLSQLAYVKEG